MIETIEHKERLGRYVNELYEKAGIETVPVFPKVLIRVLPREQKVGGIWLPDNNKQNKPTWEGIIIKTYEPRYRKIYLTEADWVKDDPDPEVRYAQKFECEFKPGDHVLFPFIDFGITPVTIDEGKGDYRCVPEHLILAKLEYQQEKLSVWLTNLLDKATKAEYKSDDSNGPEGSEFIAQYLLKHADIVRRDLVSLTMSGE